MKYYVTFKVNARYFVEVEANSPEEAKEAAESKFSDADFGDALDVDGEPAFIENENDDYLWENDSLW